MRQCTYVYHGLKSAVLILTTNQKNLQEKLKNIDIPKNISDIKLSDQKLSIEELEVPINQLVDVSNIAVTLAETNIHNYE